MLKDFNRQICVGVDSQASACDLPPSIVVTTPLGSAAIVPANPLDDVADDKHVRIEQTCRDLSLAREFRCETHAK